MEITKDNVAEVKAAIEAFETQDNEIVLTKDEQDKLTQSLKDKDTQIAELEAKLKGQQTAAPKDKKGSFLELFGIKGSEKK